MKSQHRYILLILLFIILYFIYSSKRINSSINVIQSTHFDLGTHQFKNISRNDRGYISTSLCNMATCFDWEKCKGDKIFVYPLSIDSPISPLYNSVLKALRESYFFTENPEEACLKVLSIDTSDRDKISENYVKNIDEQIQRLPTKLWNNGRNHLIFNFYSGSYPNYEYNLGFDTGQAMIAWASSNSQFFRSSFDVSFPLFHKEHLFRTLPNPINVTLLKRDRHLASFKGKRYVFGIGSETRNVLYKLNDDDRFVITTTCKHTISWKKFEDDRCAIDNENYDKWDYTELLQNSTFCFTPRGRRLGSFRFLEALGAGCIPVVLSDDWILPFSEFIDWSPVVVRWPESDVFFVADYLMEMTDAEISKRKLQSLLLYHRYFSSIENIVRSTVRNVLDRVDLQRQSWRAHDWNTFLEYEQVDSVGFAAVILANSRRPTQLSDLLTRVAELENIQKVFVFCADEYFTQCSAIVKNNSISSAAVRLIKSMRFDYVLLSDELDIEYVQFVLLFDERNAVGDVRELSVAMRLAEAHPTSLVTFHAANHKQVDSTWTLYSDSNGDEYSFALLHKAIVYRDIVERFRRVHHMTSLSAGCAAVHFNIAYAQRTLRAPLLVACNDSRRSTITVDSAFRTDLEDMSKCFGEVVRDMYDSRVPLIASSVRYLI